MRVPIRDSTARGSHSVSFSNHTMYVQVVPQHWVAVHMIIFKNILLLVCHGLVLYMWKIWICSVLVRRNKTAALSFNPLRLQEYFEKNGEPLFSSHMLDLSEEVDEENISTCVSYLERMNKMKVRKGG